DEAADLQRRGFKELTLLGQNVNSYRCTDTETVEVTDFASLLAKVAEAVPDMRIRFTTSHPRDMVDDILLTVSRYPNICRHIHLPVQSGSDKVLKAMNRHYNRADYMKRVESIRRILPDCAITTDMFTGFSGETEEDFMETMELMKEVGFDAAFMFKYSERPGTLASRHMPDNVAEEVKIDRLNRMIQLQNELSLASNTADVGKVMEVLIEAPSKRSREQMVGRTSTNKAVVVSRGNLHPGSFVNVKILSATSATLIGEVVDDENHENQAN
ncbi:MAG: MiaB/RimO family radical SAM methylthiotransferase, partial [Paramuribaculum sp.]|nr:MiaB/RimO family radical SAM methylthiotransferase [Paramuribaculum sp.]